MIIQVRSITKEQFRHRFEERIKESEKHDWKPLGFSVLGSLVGSIDEDSFVLVKTTGLFSNMPQRRFYGTLSYENDCLVAKGSFRFPRIFFIVFVAIAISIFIFLLLTHEGALTFGGIVKGLLISAAVPTLPFVGSLLMSLYFEKETIRVLEDL